MGELEQPIVGSEYLLPNLLKGKDLDTVVGLCPTNDLKYNEWTEAVRGLSTQVESFIEDPQVPATYIANTNWTVSRGIGAIAIVTNENTMVDSYALSANGPGSGFVTLVEGGAASRTEPGVPVQIHIIRVGFGLEDGEVVVMNPENPLSEYVTFQHTLDLACDTAQYEYEWKMAAPVDGGPPRKDPEMTRYQVLGNAYDVPDVPRYTLGGGTDVRTLGDNWVVMRYRPINRSHPMFNQWSDWTEPRLAEGWIKRVLAGINPFNQRVTDLFNNSINTDVSMLTQAGHRWEGDVAMNMDTINNYGLIEIYETVLRRGRGISIENGYNYAPANDALLLAAGYLSDLYMMEGNEAWADAANPTIGIGTKDKTYGDIATASFSFEGQVSSLLEEELALLRGRDDSLAPWVRTPPIYNRLVWNYTRGIDAGEVIYAINYNIQPVPGSVSSSIGASDAAHMYPQGHGDAYGHYLTAVSGYYSLLLNSCFEWVPRIEAVNVLGVPVAVDYLDERKFAKAASALARSGRQIFDLTWRRDYQQVHQVGWGQFEESRHNEDQGTVRYWGHGSLGQPDVARRLRQLDGCQCAPTRRGSQPQSSRHPKDRPHHGAGTSRACQHGERSADRHGQRGGRPEPAGHSRGRHRLRHRSQCRSRHGQRNAFRADLPAGRRGAQQRGGLL